MAPTTGATPSLGSVAVVLEARNDAMATHSSVKPYHCEHSTPATLLATPGNTADGSNRMTAPPTSSTAAFARSSLSSFEARRSSGPDSPDAPDDGDDGDDDKEGEDVDGVAESPS